MKMRVVGSSVSDIKYALNMKFNIRVESKVDQSWVWWMFEDTALMEPTVLSHLVMSISLMIYWRKRRCWFKRHIYHQAIQAYHQS